MNKVSMCALFAAGLLSVASGGVLVKSVSPGSTVNIDSATVSDGGILFTNSFERGEVRTVSDIFPQRTQKQLLANANLSEWRVASGHIRGLGYVDDDVLPFNIVRRDGEMDVQLQSRSGLFQRCLKIRLIQNGDDIDIVYVYSRFFRYALAGVQMGVNFDAIPLDANGLAGRCAVDCDLKAGLTEPPTSGDGAAFGLTSLTLEKIGAAGTFHVSATVTPGGTLTVGDNVAVGLTGEAVRGTDGSATNGNALAVGGSLAFGGLDSPLVLSGTVTDAVPTDETFAGEEWTASLGTVKPTAVIPNAKLGQLKAFRDIAMSGSTTAAVFHVESDGQTATMQFQGFFADNYVACCYVTMTQQGEDIHVRMTKAVYIWDRVPVVGKSSFFGSNFNSVTPSGNWNFHISSATMVMERAKVAPVLSAGASGGQLAFGGCEKRADVALLLPDRLRNHSVTPKVNVTRTLQNVRLCMLKGFTDINMSGSTTAAVYCVDHRGDALTMQVHGFFSAVPSYTACCYVKMWQSGNDVLIRQTGAEYVSESSSDIKNSVAFGKDFSTLSPKKTWDYDVKFMTSVFAVPQHKVPFGTLKTGQKVYVRGMCLKDLRGFSDLNLANSDITKNGAFFLKSTNDWQTATVQLQAQFDGGRPFAACCYVEMRQVGPDIEMEMVKPCYIYNADAPSGVSYYGNDFDLLEGYKVDKWLYQPKCGSLLFVGERAVTTLSGANTMTGASLVVQTNASVIVSAGGNLPLSGTIEVAAGGALALNGNRTANGGQTIVIRRGGSLSQGAFESVFDPRRTYLLFEGGEMWLSKMGATHADNSSAYVNFYTFQNGGRMAGGFKPMLLGYSDGYITVTGSEPAYWACGGLLVGQLNGPPSGFWTLYVNVDDVTGNDEPDFVSSGAFRDWGKVGATNVSNRAFVRKRGAGTWRIDEASPLLSSFVVVEEGALELNADNVMPLAGINGRGVTLSGGTLALAAGTSNALVALTLGGSSVIRVGEGATLVIGNSSANVWADGATLDFTGAVGSQSVRFGTDRRGLTPAQRRALRFNGKRMTLNEAGYLAEPEGMVLIVR